MSQFLDEIMAEARDMMKSAADERQPQDQQIPQQPVEMQQDDLAASADRVLSQLRGILEASGVPMDQPDATSQAYGGAPQGSVGGSPVININVGGLPKTASRLLAEARLRLVDPIGAIAMRLAGGR